MEIEERAVRLGKRLEPLCFGRFFSSYDRFYEDSIDRYPYRVYNNPRRPIGIDGNGKAGVFMGMEEEKGCCCHKTKERTAEEYKDLIHRLNRIEGQIRGIKGMVERDAYCTDILTQVSAVTAALNSFNKVLLANHIRTCVATDIREGKDDTIDELVVTLQKLMR